MVERRTKMELHPIERLLVAAISEGREASIADLGGIHAIESASKALAESPMMPALLESCLRYWDAASVEERQGLEIVLSALVDGASAEFVVMEAIDILDFHRVLSERANERCFQIFLSKSQNSGLPGLTRAAFLDGAFRWALGNPRWRYRLLDVLLGITVDDDSAFLTRATKILGIAYSHWRESPLAAKLAEFAEVEWMATEASFELGMANLADGLDELYFESALDCFHRAKSWFEKALSGTESNPEADLYLSCLDLLSDFKAGCQSERLRALFQRISLDAFELDEWVVHDSVPSWLGARRTQAVCWRGLASTILGLTEYLEQASWWEPGAVIQEYVLAAYTIGRTILRRDRSKNVEELVRPRIKATLAKQIGQAQQLKYWISHNPGHELEFEAKGLLSAVDELVKEGLGSTRPSMAGIAGNRIPALIDNSRLPERTKDILLRVVANAVALQTDNLSSAEIQIIEECSKAAAAHPDWHRNAHGQRLHDTLLLWIVRFLRSRLEHAQGDDPKVSYLFEQNDDRLPTEKELQQDFMQWVACNTAGAAVEPTSVGAGRADVLVRSGSEHLIVEIKRETEDASFEAISSIYLTQAASYQNVSIRLGFLLVLDLTRIRDEGTPHITSLVQTKSIRIPDDNFSRMITIVKVPGRRIRPSDLTKIAKRKASRQRRLQPGKSR